MPTKEWKLKNKDNILAYQREWYRKNKKTEVARVLKRRQEIKQWFSEYKSTLKCSKCSESHPACLDFHHIQSDNKEETISVMVASGRSRKSILNEIKKCDVLCSNCHRKLHALLASIV